MMALAGKPPWFSLKCFKVQRMRIVEETAIITDEDHKGL
jgi:hypothetical protein